MEDPSNKTLYENSNISANPSEYRLSCHFGILGGISQNTFLEQRLSQYFTRDDRHSFIDKQLSTHARLVQSKRDMGQYFWGNRRTKKPLHRFCTGSRYIGEWNAISFSGEGVYRFPHGVIYEGEFNKNGQFHGLGSLIYPNGQKLEGVWKNGQLEDDSTYIYASSEILDETFNYCQQPDRRFHTEIQKNFEPAGKEYLTADQPTKKLPEGCYDVGDGIYDPKTMCIMSYPKTTISKKDIPITFHLYEEKAEQLREILEDTTDIPYYSIKSDKEFKTVDECTFIEIPKDKKVRWIKEQCRKAWDEPTGYRPDLYEKWTIGRQNESVWITPSFEGISSIFQENEKEPSEEFDKPKFVSFIQNPLSLEGRIKNRTSTMRQENKKRAEERRMKTLNIEMKENSL